MTRRSALWVGLTALVLSVLLGASVTVLVAGNPGIDIWWHDLMVSVRTDATVAVSTVLNWIGGGVVAILVIPGIVLVGLLLARMPRQAIFATLCFALSALVVQALKHLFARMRPEDMLVASDHGSYPSGHTANAVTIALVMYLVFPRIWVAIAGMVWAVAMGLSRTVLSVHWLGDVVGGALVGASVVLVVLAVGWRWLSGAHIPVPK